MADPERQRLSPLRGIDRIAAYNRLLSVAIWSTVRKVYFLSCVYR
jgi:hypothetical protein